jgi:hypothetical protein
MVDPMATARGRVLISVAAVVLAAIAVPVFASASSSRALGSEARSLYALSCPSTTQCTALDGAGREITFDPTSPPRHVSRHKALRYSHNLSCPSITFCVAEDGLNPEHGVAFVPTSGRVLNRFTFSEAKAGQVIGWKALTCVSAGQCTTVSYEGIELTFDPRTGGTISNATLPHSSEGLSSVTCPSPTQCTAIFDDSTGTLQGYEVTFDPTTGVPNAAGAAVVDWTGLQRLACPSATQCTAVDHYGQEVTFDPTTGQQTGAGLVTLFEGHGRFLGALSCPSVDLCVAANAFGQEMPFNPNTGARGSSHSLGPAAWNTSACPSVTKCTFVAGGAKETTFNPAKAPRAVFRIERRP